ncbi:MAG TPA: FadR/GntR family transcriptional regulator [Candidatus Binatia bacterium]|nr:FadR/GntR family transcriptional regulator [Candidatus Binatia bacterium]
MNPPRLTDVAIGRIMDKIASGELAPGQRLPREQDLAGQLGLSRSSLREAVRALTLVRVLETRQGDGTYVTSLNSRLLLESVAFVTHLWGDSQMLEMWEVRRLLEPTAAALAAARMTSAEHLQLKACLDRFATASNVEETMQADEAFHRYINQCSGNSVLESVIETMSVRTLRMRAWRKATDEAHRKAAYEEHVPIYDAIVARDPELVRAAAAMHVAEGELWWRRSMASTAASEREAVG